MSDGTTLFYRVGGNPNAKETIIFLSGWTSDSNFWLSYLPAFTDFRYILIDNRGVGKTTIPPNLTISMQSMIEDIHALITIFKGTQVILCGISMGGMIAQNFALNYPSLCKKLILISTSAYITPKMKFIFETLVKLEESPQRDLFVDLLLGHCYNAKTWIDPKLKFSFDQTRDYKKNHPQNSGACRKQAEAIFQHDVRDKIGKINVPTMIIGGAEDEIIPIDMSKELHELIPNSKLLILPNEGHVPTDLSWLKTVHEFCH
jgi:pimeloyl-ACP methyl ester carboxylesterase